MVFMVNPKIFQREVEYIYHNVKENRVCPQKIFLLLSIAIFQAKLIIT